MKKTINEIFDYCPGNHGLTEEIMYNNQPVSNEDRIPVFSGSMDNNIPIGFIKTNALNNKGKPIVYYHGPCLILTKDGSAGLFTYKSANDGRFTINHHACVIKLKSAWSNVIDIEWFGLEYRSALRNYTTSKSDNSVLSSKWFDRVRFSIPDDIQIQIRNKNRKKKILELKSHLLSIISNIDLLLTNSKTETQGETDTVDNVFHFMGGNQGLTEEFVYNNAPTSEDNEITVCSSATKKENYMGLINRNSKPKGGGLKVYSSPCIVVARNGNAGTMEFLDENEYSGNDHVYFLKLKEEYTGKVNMRWFCYQYQDLFLRIVTSKSDNATFNKDYARKQEILLPEISYQNTIALKLHQLNSLRATIYELLPQSDKLLNSQFSAE